MLISKKLNWIYLGSILFILLNTIYTSCVPIKKVIYFNDIPDTLTTPYKLENSAKVAPQIIQPSDVLAITIQTIEQNSSNTPITTNSVGSYSPLNGFLVDPNGEIDLSLIGTVKVAGLTIWEARELIKQRAREFYKEPVVNIRIANFIVNVLGDVGKPGPLTILDEKPSIMDVMALAGDIQLTAKKDNIILVRTENGEHKVVRLDLNSSKIYQSPYFYVKNRDLIYVQARNHKLRDSDDRLTKYIGVVSAFLSIAILLIALRNTKL